MLSKGSAVKRTDTRKTAYAVIFVAMGVALAPFTSIPVGIARINPTQHFVNILGAVILGPWWAVMIAGVIGLIRNITGMGTLLAFPGGMIGAFLAGIVYAGTRNLYLGAAGEIIGTGLIAPVVSALLVAPFLMGQAIPLLALIPSFLGSTLAGSVLGVMAVKLLHRAGIIELGA
ncbi:MULTISPECIES: energy coupling factor transporter S component ThiW [Desulfococcus]|jgi:energy-coupling factor transport system ATP-binding protein|uniref:ThiW protein n=1 Tax=Desulfococcus multivorans DSM 2059 TaxID=1121405 RepID=S7TKP6_DESML|nr:energy coupling factor transporter S component ThiW [Desulfococcus multivorans]AOY58701.1 ThiW protein [Desulfococcus multivorans]AQV00987.1 energy coupling factor transporter S component ThiW [Desulfococcus multivorans]EPR37747.1 thiW protein [Desulfococcus multivorans DSM 2059]SJZ46575.1 energy coupling factor transporter S component ThiW [Desulfococcus multivorans DSM 2059]